MIRFAAVLAAALVLAAAPALAQQKPEARDMRLVGYSDLQGRSAYQPVIHQQNGRWIAYIGHHGGVPGNEKPVNALTGQPEFSGTSIVDVTDPKQPKYLAHIPGEQGNYEAGGAQMVRVCDGKSLKQGDPAAVYLLRPFGNQAHEIWNTADPAHPKLVTRIVEGLKGTHKSWWECDTGIAYLVSGEPGWRVARMTQVYDLSDPVHPVKIRDFGLPGQQPGASGATPTMLHGMISLPQANRVYFGYGTNEGGILQIVDREKLINGPKSALSRSRPLSDVAAQRRAHDLPDARRADRRVRQGQDRQGTKFCRHHRRADPERMPGAAAVRLVCRCDGREPAGLGRDLDGAGSLRQFLQPRRPLRHAFLEREHDADLLQAGHVLRAFQCRGTGRRHSRPVSSEGDRVLHPGGHRA